jgi:hypothetical protein
VPVLLGGIARDEMPFWPSSNKADGWAVVADVYIHLIFFSAFYVLPYVLLSAAYKEHTSGMKGMVTPVLRLSRRTAPIRPKAQTQSASARELVNSFLVRLASCVAKFLKSLATLSGAGTNH